MPRAALPWRAVTHVLSGSKATIRLMAGSRRHRAQVIARTLPSVRAQVFRCLLPHVVGVAPIDAD